MLFLFVTITMMGVHETMSVRPNIVVVITDDQDVMLGSLQHMPRVRRLLIDKGVR